VSAPTTLPTLLLRVRDPADQEAWRRFETRYGGLIVAYGRSRGLSLWDAEDVRQTVLLNLSTALRRFEYQPARGRFRDYLGRIVRNAVARHRGGHTLPGATLDMDELAAPAAGDETPDAAWEREWVNLHCRAALDELRATYDARSMAVFERILAGEGMAAIAASCGMTCAAVRKVKQRVKDELRAIVQRRIEEEESHGGQA